MDIGQNVQPLIGNNLEAERKEGSTVKLVDYRGIVDQDYIKSGLNFNTFMTWLTGYIQAEVGKLKN